MALYLRAKFEVSSMNLTSFRQGAVSFTYKINIPAHIFIT